jgi:hypothetical protein
VTTSRTEPLHLLRDSALVITTANFHREEKPFSRVVVRGFTICLRFPGVDGVLGLLRLRHLLRAIADE